MVPYAQNASKNAEFKRLAETPGALPKHKQEDLVSRAPTTAREVGFLASSVREHPSMAHTTGQGCVLASPTTPKGVPVCTAGVGYTLSNTEEVVHGYLDTNPWNYWVDQKLLWFK